MDARLIESTKPDGTVIRHARYMPRALAAYIKKHKKGDWRDPEVGKMVLIELLTKYPTATAVADILNISKASMSTWMKMFDIRIER